MVQEMETQSLVLDKNTDLKTLQETFKNFATKAGYPNLQLSLENIYDNLFEVYNVRTKVKLFEVYDTTEVVFDSKHHKITVGDFEYREDIRGLRGTDGKVETDRFESIPAFRPYNKLHKPDLGRGVVFGDGYFTITGVETKPNCELCYVTFGPYTLRSDDFLKDCRYLNGDVCGCIEEECKD